MKPLDVNPLNSHPSTTNDPIRHAAHARRWEAQHLAADARNDVLDVMTRAGISHADARHVTDALIMAVRTADAMRLTYARGHISHTYTDTDGRERLDLWGGIRDLNGAEDFLHATTRAHPVQPDAV